MTSQENDTKLISFLAAMCLFLSAVEYAIPKPLPFLRLGLANVPILLALTKLSPKKVLFLILLKVLGQGFISGTFFSYIFLFSASGSFTGGLAMLAAHRFLKKHISYIGISLAGAMGNTAAQLILSQLVLFGDGTRFIAPILLITATITGIVLGLFTNLFAGKSRWFLQIQDYTR